jgi:hypothetical protein
VGFLSSALAKALSLLGNLLGFGRPAAPWPMLI